MTSYENAFGTSRGVSYLLAFSLAAVFVVLLFTAIAALVISVALWEAAGELAVLIALWDLHPILASSLIAFGLAACAFLWSGKDIWLKR